MHRMLLIVFTFLLSCGSSKDSTDELMKKIRLTLETNDAQQIDILGKELLARADVTYEDCLELVLTIKELDKDDLALGFVNKGVKMTDDHNAAVHMEVIGVEIRRLKGDFTNCIHILDSLIRVPDLDNINYHDVHFELGYCFSELGQFENAIVPYSKALKSVEFSQSEVLTMAAAYNLCIAYLNSGRRDSSIVLNKKYNLELDSLITAQEHQ
jgi:tetratricopeptide (TPR) repeat protein